MSIDEATDNWSNGLLNEFWHHEVSPDHPIEHPKVDRPMQLILRKRYRDGYYRLDDPYVLPEEDEEA